MGRQLVDLLDEWFIHVVTAAIRKVHDVDLVVEDEVEGVHEPGREGLSILREDLKDVDLSVWRDAWAVLVQ